MVGDVAVYEAFLLRSWDLLHWSVGVAFSAVFLHLLLRPNGDSEE